MPQNIRVWFHSGCPVYLSAKLAEQGCVCTGGAEPSSEGAAECGVHDSGACRARIHHSLAAAYHAQPYRDWAAHLRPALHQLGVPEGEAVLILLTNNCHHSSRQGLCFFVWQANNTRWVLFACQCCMSVSHKNVKQRAKCQHLEDRKE